MVVLKSTELLSYSCWQDCCIKLRSFIWYLRYIRSYNEYVLTTWKIYKQVLKNICNKYPGSEKYINDGIEELCSHYMLSVDEVMFFSVYNLFLYFFSIEIDF